MAQTGNASKVSRARRGSDEHTQDLLSWARPEQPEDGALLYVDREKIAANIENPRRNFDTAEIEGLAQSLRVHGIIKPLTVRYAPSNLGTTYELIDGERRWRAAKLAGLERLPVLVKSTENKFEQLVLSLVANVQQARLSPFEEAEAVGSIQKTLGLSTNGLVELIGRGKEDTLLSPEGKGKGWVENRLAAFALPAHLKDVLKERPDSLSSLLLIHRRIKDTALQRRLAIRVRHGASWREVQEQVNALVATQKPTTPAKEEAASPVETRQGWGMKTGGGVEVTRSPEAEEELFPVESDSSQSEEEDAPGETGQVDAAQVLSTPQAQATVDELRKAAAHDRHIQSTGQGAQVVLAPEERVRPRVMELLEEVRGAKPSELAPLYADLLDLLAPWKGWKD